MHLRISEEAEMIGLDLHHFFDEQIGERNWNVFGTARDGLSRPGILNDLNTSPSGQTDCGESEMARKETEIGIRDARTDRTTANV